ncbi:MAG: transcriptional regulator [Oscillospiraceae bacterium]|nr:transcriptional regulator [Oscillospiraceae bacterium]
MSKLTFKGFLRKYIRNLSYTDTCGLYQLAKEASTNNPRLCEPLFLYALFWNKEDVLLKATKNDKLRQEYTNHLTNNKSEVLMQELISGTSLLPERYNRIYQSYLAIRDKTKSENHTKLLMHNRIIKLQQDKNVTTYRLYKDMKLNHGNLTAFLKHADCQKISLENVRKTLAYLESYPAALSTHAAQPLEPK